jgi:uncharacterized membrane protein
VRAAPEWRLRRPLLAAAAVIVLLALVVLAAAGHRPGGGGSAARPSGYVIDTLVTILLAVYAVAAVATAWLFLSVGSEKRRREPAGAGLRRTLGATLLAFLVLAVLVVAGDRLSGLVRSDDANQTSTLSRAEALRREREKRARERKQHDPQFRLGPFLFVLGAVGAGAVALYLAERRRRGPPSDPRMALELDDVLADTLDDRRAVLRAYARMERVLSAHGIPRRVSEAPVEYLARVLIDLATNPVPVRRLTALFERARFSAHAIDADMRTEAIEAIEALQAELRAAEEVRAA